MNRITLVLLIFALCMNVLLIVVEVTNQDTLNLCSSAQKKAFGGQSVGGCYTSEATKIITNFIVLMVAAIPIATPVVVTATMAIGARKMADAHAVVTRLSAIEELAGMTVLCSDKTGTLTKVNAHNFLGESLQGEKKEKAEPQSADALFSFVRLSPTLPLAQCIFLFLSFLYFRSASVCAYFPPFLPDSFWSV